MERQLVAPTIDQWRAVQRSQRDQAAAYNPLEITRGFRPRNRQLLRITSDTPDDATGFFPAVWIQSDVTDQSHTDQSEVWAWPIDGNGAEDAFFEGETVGTHEDKPVFRGSVIDEGFPDIVRVVTNVCHVGTAEGSEYRAGTDYEIDTEGGQAILAFTYSVKAPPLKVKAVVIWKDPGYASSSGDAFGFYLKVGDNSYTGAPEHMVTTIGTTTTKEMEWTLPGIQQGEYTISLWAYRVSGSWGLTADAESRVVMEGAVGGQKVEYRQLIVSGAYVGNKVCVMNPTDCCIDDDTSNADGSDLTVDCCSVPIPAMRSVDLSGTAGNKPGWFPLGFGYWGNFDYLIDRIEEELAKLHYLPFVGTEVDTRTRCVYAKDIYISDARWASFFGLSPDEEETGDVVYDSTFRIRISFRIAERWAGEPSPFYDWTLVEGVPIGWIAAPEYQAHCKLSVDYFTSAGPWDGSISLGELWTPHYSKEFYGTQDPLTLPSGVPDRLSELPDPTTSCAGDCRLWGPGELTGGVIECPWLVEVLPV